MINPELLDTILLEWSYRLKDGIPDVNDPEKVKVLNQVLAENKLPTLESLLMEDTTENESETLCMYFCVLSDSTFTAAEKHLEAVSKSKEVLIPDSKANLKLSGYNFGDNLGNGDKSLDLLLKEYNKGFNKDNNKLNRFINAITSARLIRKQYGGPVAPGNIDRGKSKFEKIKLRALELLKDSYEIDIKAGEVDKWSPADIMIYNGVGIKEVNQAKQLNVSTDKTPALNELFLPSISNEKGIVGISLKQQEAQGGKALSFKSTLKRDENYPKADNLEPDDKSLMEFLYNVNASTTEAKSGKTLTKNEIKIGYLVEIIRLASKQPSSDAIKKETGNTLLNTFSQIPKETLKKMDGKYIPGTTREYSWNASDPYSQLYKTKDLARASFKAFKLEDIVYTNNFDKEVNEYNLAALIPAMDVYETIKKDFIKALGSRDYNAAQVKELTSDEVLKAWESEASQVLYKKASCYKVATWLLTGLDKGGLLIPEGFSSLAEEKDPFVALTAYAIGFAGISPPFIKVIGSENIQNDAHSQPMGGDGVLKLQKNTKVTILDSATNKGFQCMMELEALRVKYKVTLDFRFSGDQINIEVSKISS